jgi:hypothetical protein
MDTYDAQQSVLWPTGIAVGTTRLSSMGRSGNMKVQCTWRLVFVSSNQARAMETSADSIMNALLASEQSNQQLHDAALSLDLETRELEISLVSDCGSIDDGIQSAMTAITAAINTAGGAISEWTDSETERSTVRWSVQHEELVFS